MALYLCISGGDHRFLEFILCWEAPGDVFHDSTPLPAPLSEGSAKKTFSQKLGITEVICWCAHTLEQICIRFASTPELASPKLSKAVLLCVSFFMSAANSSYCWPKVLSQSPGNFCYITLIILLKMCSGGRAFIGFRLKAYFERINGMILWHLKYHSAVLQPSHPWVSLELALH